MNWNASDAEKIPWAAGLFEVEGSITMHGDRLALSLNNTDFSVVNRFGDVLGLGTVYGPYSYERQADGYARKPFCVWVAHEVDAPEALSILGPWLSRRRLARAFKLTGLVFTSFGLSPPEERA